MLIDRTCKNCKWFREGKTITKKGWFFTDTQNEPDVCAFLNNLECSEARIYNVPTAWGKDGSTGMVYIAAHKQVEGPCKARGVFWEPIP